jgi:SOS-response transcriptional repressor LexA
MNFTEGGCSEAEPYALQVLGDSMEPEFEDGCIVIIDPAGHVQNGVYVIAVHEEEYIFRQLLIEDQRFFLCALNNAYPRIEINGMEGIQGVIVQKAGRRRRDRKHYI